MLKPRLGHVPAALLGIAAGVILIGGLAAWRLSQGTLPANALRPVAERWLETGVRGGRARIGAVEIAWFGRARALGLELHDVSMSDEAGRPVLRARRLEAGLALASLIGAQPSPGRLAAQNFFAAVSVSPQGRYALGYEAARGAPAGGGNLWRMLDDLTGRPRLGRPMSFLEQLDLTDGQLALTEIGGPVSWRGEIKQIRFDKTGGRLHALADARVGGASLGVQADGVVGLKQALLKIAVADLDPARVFPWAGATGAISTLDAPVQGEGWIRWAADKGVLGADVHLTAGEGHVRLSGSPTPFQSGEIRAAFDPRSQRVLIQAIRAASDQADFDMTGQAWLTPESRSAGPARLELALNAGDSRLSLTPGAPPAEVRDFALRARYVPANGKIEIDGVRALAGGAPLTLTGTLQRPRDQRSWGASLDGRIAGMMTPQTVVALWPNELGGDTRGWVRDHIKAGRLGQAVFRLRLAPGEVQPRRPMGDDRLRLTYAFDSADIAVDGAMPLIQGARGAATLQGDRYDMAIQSASIQGVQLSEGVLHVPWLMGDGKRIEVDGRAVGDARAILHVVDKSTSGMASVHGFQPQRLSGRGDVLFSLGRSLEVGPDHFAAAYRGQIHDAGITGAALGMTLRASTLSIEGSMDGLSAKGAVQLGPYRGPLQYQADFAGRRPMSQKALFDGALDASTMGLSGPSGSSLRFAARFDDAAGSGHGVIRSKAFDGQTSWTSNGPGRFLAQGVMYADALRAVGVPVGKGVPDRTPMRLTLNQSGDGWTGALDADAYSGAIAVSSGPTRRVHYATQLTPERAQKLGLAAEAAGGKPVSVVLDVATNGENGSASYGLGAWLGQVSWSQTAGARTQYRWRTTLSATDLHALGLPSGLDPAAPIPVDVILSSTGGTWAGSAQVAGGDFRFNASAPLKGRRRLNLAGTVDGRALSDLGLGPQGMITGPAGVTAALDLGPDGVRSGHVETDLQRAAFDAPFVPWRKPAGRPMQISADFLRQGGGVEVSDVRGQGPGFGLAASGEWKAGAGGVLRVSNAKLEGAFDGSLDLALSDTGRRLTARARYFDARRLLQQGGQAVKVSGEGRSVGSGKPFALDAQLVQVRVSDQAMVRNVKIVGDLGSAERGPLEIGVARDDGASLVVLHLHPDAAGMAISGQVSDVGEAAYVLFGRRSFRGGQAVVNGRLVEGGADLRVEITKVRLMQTPALARILTMASFHGMADTLDGAGIEFTKVLAPVSIRGARLSIGRARATGPAMGITTQGVIDVDNHTVDLWGGIAPSYVLNSAMGAVPVVGKLLVSHKGEGMFGLTYSAKGAFSAPKISVNPFSLATPGILRRIFETHSANERLASAGS